MVPNCNLGQSYWVYWYGEYLDSVERDRAGLLWWDGWLGLVGLLPLAFLRQEGRAGSHGGWGWDGGGYLAVVLHPPSSGVSQKERLSTGWFLF